MRAACAPALALAAVCAAASARAALGEPASSIPADRRALGAVVRAKTVRHGYTVEEMRSGSVTLREYVSPDGLVFAIAWDGLAHPDLKPLLGSYAAEYEGAAHAAAHAPGGRRQRLSSERLVVERWGHMRDRHGRAYAPALLPAGVPLDAVR
jgi:Protein of unknown function (DUF2844)